MAAQSLPAIETLPTLPTDKRAHVLDLLFEPSPSLHTLSVSLLQTQPFTSYADLIASIGVQLTDLADSSSTSDTAWLDQILGAHPRLGAAKVDSAQSAAEQAQLNAGGAGAGGADEAELLRELNRRYEDAYPGLRYVVFVNGRGRDVIMEDMRVRIQRGDIGAERADAIRAMCEIAADRARKLEAAR